MSKIRLTDEDAEKGAFELIPEGIHPFTVTAVGDVSMSQNQKEYLPVTLDIDGLEMKEKIFLTKDSHWRLARFLKSLKGGESLGDLDFDPEKCKWIVGKSGQCLIAHRIATDEKWKGKKFPEVKNYEWGNNLAASEKEEDDEKVPF